MAWIVGILAAMAAFAITGRKASARSGGPVSKSPYSVQVWGPVLSPLCEMAGIPLEFALKWVAMESDGNPCAIGHPGAKGPDGNPREIGLAQLWNPDDFQKFGVDQNKLRAYCVPGVGQVARALTAEEMAYAARAAMALISHCRTVAEGKLKQTGAQWPYRDTWKLTKLVHALPGLVNGLVTVTKHLGRAPEDWEEFAGLVLGGEVKFDHGTEAYRADFPRELLNASEAGAAAPEAEA